MSDSYGFACPNCGTDVTTRAAMIGRRFVCPNCFQRIVVPRPHRDRRQAVPEPARAPLGWFGLGLIVLAVLIAVVLAAVRTPTTVHLVLDLAATVLLVVGFGLAVVGMLTGRGEVGGGVGAALGFLLIVGVGVMWVRGYNGAVNRANYDRIEPGMSVGEVQAILGRGERLGSAQFVNSKYLWESSVPYRPRRSIVVDVWDDWVTSKMEFGLDD